MTSASSRGGATLLREFRPAGSRVCLRAMARRRLGGPGGESGRDDYTLVARPAAGRVAGRPGGHRQGDRGGRAKGEEGDEGKDKGKEKDKEKDKEKETDSPALRALRGPGLRAQMFGGMQPSCASYVEI